MSASDLKSKLSQATGKNSGLCKEAEQHIRDLEDVLLGLEQHLMFPNMPSRRLKEPMLKAVQRGLYSPESFAGLYPEEGADANDEEAAKA